MSGSRPTDTQRLCFPCARQHLHRAALAANANNQGVGSAPRPGHRAHVRERKPWSKRQHPNRQVTTATRAPNSSRRQTLLF